MTNYMIYMMYIYDIYIYIHNSQNQTKTKLRFVVDLFFVSDIPFFFCYDNIHEPTGQYGGQKWIFDMIKVEPVWYVINNIIL